MRMLKFVPVVCLVLLCANQLATAQDKEPAYEGKTVSEWIQRLKDKDDRVRQKAAFCLRQLGPEAKAAVPALVGVLKDKNVDIRQEAAFALQRIGPAAKPAIPALIDALKDDDNYVRFWSIRALGDFGADARAAAPALTQILKAPDAELRVQAARALWRMREKKDEALTTLIDALNKNWDPSAAGVLAEIGPAAKPAVPALLAALERPGPVSPGRCGDSVMRHLAVRDSILDALKKIDPKAAKKAGGGPKGDRLAKPVPVDVDGKPLVRERAGLFPFVGDFFGDGRQALLLGYGGDGDAEEGRLLVYRNVGTRTSPRLAAPQWFHDIVPTGRIPAGSG